jgi:hypothetical protein
MVTTVTFTGTTAGTITGLSPGIPYYYQITAFNGTTPNTPSAIQKSPTAGGNSSGQTNKLVLINGKLYSDTTSIGLQLAIQGVNITSSSLTPSVNGAIASSVGQTIVDSNLNVYSIVAGP